MAETTKLPNGETAIRVGNNGEHIVVTPGNSHRPPAADYLKRGRRTRLVPADVIAAWANAELDNGEYLHRSLLDLLDRLSGAPKFSPPIERRTG